MKFKEVLGRLTGFSVPVFGVSWNPPEPEVQRARRVITQLEDRRVLFNDSALEVPDHCVHSVIEIRRMLTGELEQLDPQNELATSLRAMRASCRKFLDDVQASDDRIVRFAAQRGHSASWTFMWRSVSCAVSSGSTSRSSRQRTASTSRTGSHRSSLPTLEKVTPNPSLQRTPPGRSPGRCR